MYPRDLSPTGKAIFLIVWVGTFALIYVPLAIMMRETAWSAVIATFIWGASVNVFGLTITSWIAHGTKGVGIEWFKGGVVVGALLGGTGGAVLGNQPFILGEIIFFWALVGGLVGGVLGVVIGATIGIWKRISIAIKLRTCHSERNEVE